MSEVRECSKRVGTWHCMVLTRLPGGLCSAHQPKAATRRNRALSAARDEVVRAAVAWHRMEHGATDALDAAVAAYEKLAKP